MKLNRISHSFGRANQAVRLSTFTDQELSIKSFLGMAQSVWQMMGPMPAGTDLKFSYISFVRAKLLLRGEAASK
jgi:hypothetical protein